MKTLREHFGSRIGFILAAAGSAIGLGSLWRFPYIAGENGGGAFVLLYLIFTVLIGLPAFLSELIVGRSAQKGSVLAYSILGKDSHNWKMLGWINVLTCFIILSYYCVVAGWSLNYALMSISQFTLGKSPDQIRNVFNVVHSSVGLNLFWLFIFILLNIGILLGGVRQGIEQWSRILMPWLFVILIGMLIYGSTMPGFPKALRFIFEPSFSKLSPSSILDALGMAFFTLSVGLGISVTYGSYLKRGEDIPKTGIIVTIMTVAVSMLAALIIFPIVFTFNFPASGGPGLVFQTLPVAFAKLPGNLVISTVFFILLLFSALTSTIALFEVLNSNMIELYGWTRKKTVLITSALVFILGIPSALSGSGILFPKWKEIYGRDFFDTLNYITGSYMMPIAGLLTLIFVGYIMDKKMSSHEFRNGSKYKFLFKPWLYLIRYVAPIAVILIILQEANILDFNAIFSSF